FPGRRRNRRHHVAVGVDFGVFQPERLELGDQRLLEDHLRRRTRHRRGAVVRARVELDVAEEPVEDRTDDHYSNVAITGAWSLVPTSASTGQLFTVAARAVLAKM